jgi:GxxExxY protein
MSVSRRRCGNVVFRWSARCRCGCYLDVDLDCGYRIDMLVERVVVVEVKVVEKLAPVHTSQVLSYLRLADLHIGLLFNFNVESLAAGGWKRVLGSG